MDFLQILTSLAFWRRLVKSPLSVSWHVSECWGWQYLICIRTSLLRMLLSMRGSLGPFDVLPGFLSVSVNFWLASSVSATAIVTGLSTTALRGGAVSYIFYSYLPNLTCTIQNEKMIAFAGATRGKEGWLRSSLTSETRAPPQKNSVERKPERLRKPLACGGPSWQWRAAPHWCALQSGRACSKFQDIVINCRLKRGFSNSTAKPSPTPPPPSPSASTVPLLPRKRDHMSHQNCS